MLASARHATLAFAACAAATLGLALPAGAAAESEHARDFTQALPDARQVGEPTAVQMRAAERRRGVGPEGRVIYRTRAIEAPGTLRPRRGGRGDRPARVPRAPARGGRGASGSRPTTATPSTWAAPTRCRCAAAGRRSKAGCTTSTSPAHDPTAVARTSLRSAPEAPLRRAEAEVRRPRGLGRELRRGRMQPAQPGRAGPGQGGGHPPHRDRERLLRGGGTGDRARDLPLPPQRQRLERHRLQRARRPLRQPLPGPRRRDRRSVVGAQAQGFNAQTTAIASIGTTRPRRRPARAKRVDRPTTWPGGSTWSASTRRREDDGDLGRRRAEPLRPTGARVRVKPVFGHSDVGLHRVPRGRAHAPGSRRSAAPCRRGSTSTAAARRPSPTRPRRCPAAGGVEPPRRLGGSAVGGEEPGAGHARREPLVGGRVADDLVGAEGKLAVGEAALELLQPVAGPTPPPRLSGSPSSSARSSIAATTGSSTATPRRVLVGGAAEVVVQDAVAARRERRGRRLAVAARRATQPAALGGEHGSEVVRARRSSARRRRRAASSRCRRRGSRRGPRRRTRGRRRLATAYPAALVLADLLAVAHPRLRSPRRVVQTRTTERSVPPASARGSPSRSRTKTLTSPAATRSTLAGSSGAPLDLRALGSRRARSRRGARSPGSRAPPAARRRASRPSAMRSVCVTSPRPRGTRASGRSPRSAAAAPRSAISSARADGVPPSAPASPRAVSPQTSLSIRLVAAADRGSASCPRAASRGR